LLLVLDNCEHLINACATLTEKLLRSVPNLRILVTSREPLAIAGEAVFRVPSLGLPDADRLADVISLGGHESVELFVDRARSVKSTFAITDANALSVAKLCVQLEGMPLAIELAASRLNALTVEQIAVRLDDRLSLLTIGRRTALERHQTLFAAIDWSYNLLTEPEKILFRRLAVFSGSWTLDAAEAVCAGAGVDKRNVLDLTSGLVDKSLVLSEERDGHLRYRFMVTLREYAYKRLTQTEEGEGLTRRHAEFFEALVAEAEPQLVSTEQKAGLARLNADYDNIRAVLGWTSKTDVEMGLGLAGAMCRFWYMRGYWEEGRQWLDTMLSAPDAHDFTTPRVKALNEAALLAGKRDDLAASRSFAEEALALSRVTGDRCETASALNCLAIVAGKESDFALARSFLEESLAIRRELGDRGPIVATLTNVGIVAYRQGEYEAARSLFDETLATSREVGDKHRIAAALLNRADIARRMGDLVLARSLVEEALALAKDMDDRTLTPHALNALGDLAGRQGNYAGARALLTEALAVSRALGDRRLITDQLLSLSVVADEDATARSLLEESLGISRETGDRLATAEALNCLGAVMARESDHVTARSLYEQSLAICRRIGAKDGIAQSLSGLADVARLQGDHVLALSLYRQSAAIWADLGEKLEWPHALDCMAMVLHALGRDHRAVPLWSAADALRRRIGLPRPRYEADEHDRLISAARVTLGSDRFGAAWAVGLATAIDRMLTMVLEDAPAPGSRDTP